MAVAPMIDRQPGLLSSPALPQDTQLLSGKPVMLRTFRYRLQPTSRQARTLAAWLALSW